MLFRKKELTLGDIMSDEEIRRLSARVMQDIADKKLISKRIDPDIANHPERWPQVEDDSDSEKKGLKRFFATVIKRFSGKKKTSAEEAMEIFQRAFDKVTKSKI